MVIIDSENTHEANIVVCRLVFFGVLSLATIGLVIKSVL